MPWSVDNSVANLLNIARLARRARASDFVTVTVWFPVCTTAPAHNIVRVYDSESHDDTTGKRVCLSDFVFAQRATRYFSGRGRKDRLGTRPLAPSHEWETVASLAARNSPPHPREQQRART